jgi:Uma2 family endonuclease
VASPVSIDHGKPHADLAWWLGSYRTEHPDVRTGDNTTVRLGEKNVPQPDLYLRFVKSATNRRSGNYLEGPPELVAEVAVSSRSLDLHGELEAYRTHGVLEYIVWRVYDDAIDWFWLNEGGYERLKPDRRGVVESKVFPGLRLAVPAMLKGDLKTVLAELQRPD